jgi:tRNA(Ile)-lysidine synthase TilS/MesJ
MNCDVCKVREAEVFQPHTGRRLCKECFINDVRERVRQEAERQGLFKARKVLLAVSGGKDSYVLADALAEVLKGVKLIAYNITEGISGYNREDHDVRLLQGLRVSGG